MIVTGGQRTSRMCRRHFWYFSATGNKNNNNYKKNLNPSRLMMSGSECLRVLDEVPDLRTHDGVVHSPELDSVD